MAEAEKVPTYYEARLAEIKSKRRKTKLSKIAKNDKIRSGGKGDTSVHDKYLEQYDKDEALIKRLMKAEKKETGF